jgi:processive 1,2-diacylglycerol beta-glucosyltransferase
MITLFDTATDAAVGDITEAELQYLMDNLEEESLEDRDYYISQETIDLLADDGGATDHLLAVLRAALGDTEGVELRWKKH